MDLSFTFLQSILWWQFEEHGFDVSLNRFYIDVLNEYNKNCYLISVYMFVVKSRILDTWDMEQEIDLIWVFDFLLSDIFMIEEFRIEYFLNPVLTLVMNRD